MVLSFTVTIATHTAAAVDLATLLVSGSQTGYTVAPAGGYGGGTSYTGRIPKQWSRRTIQASNGNGSAVLYVGDADTKTDGSRQGLELLAGDSDTRENDDNRVGLQGVYVRASADGAKFNVIVEGA